MKKLVSVLLVLAMAMTFASAAVADAVMPKAIAATAKRRSFFIISSILY